MKTERSPEQLSLEIRQSLDPELRPLFSREFIVCSEWYDRFTTETVGEALAGLGLVEALDSSTTAGEIVASRGFAARSAVTLSWMLEKLAEEGYLEAEGAGESRRYRRRAPLPSGSASSKEKAFAIDPACAPAFAVVEQLAENIGAFFRGEKTGEEILFSPSKLSLWFDYFNNANLLYAVNNRLGAEAVFRVLPSTRVAEVLELGGGCGSAAIALFERLEAGGRLDAIARYRFTEPVPTFLRRGERALRQRFPGVTLEAGKLDMNQDFAGQGVAVGSVDIVYAVNTIHVAQDLSSTLSRIFEALAPGGCAVFSECLRLREGQPVYVEFIFNFLENFVGVATDPAVRPTHGFLTPGNWRAALGRAGFERIEFLPDVERLSREFPTIFVGALLARRPG
jgi:SAM-dependent methyltransferase